MKAVTQDEAVIRDSYSGTVTRQYKRFPTTNHGLSESQPSCESSFQVLSKIGRRLQPHGHAQQALADACLLARRDDSLPWVVLAGCVIVVFTSPRLAVMDISRVESTTRHAASRPPLTTNDTMAPPLAC